MFNATFGSVTKIGTSDYETLANKPRINGVELSGDMTTEDLRIVGGLEAVDEIRQGEMRPVTSNAVYVGVGNIEALLHTL